MKSNAPITRRLLRPALMLGAALGVAFGLLPGASAQVTGPQPNSPAVPTPYQAPVFHSGGAQDPIPAADLPLFSERLQGTPTGPGRDGTTPTQIPSYLLGAYDPTTPPGANPTVGNGHYPEHFADGGIYQWAAPFDYISQAAQQITVDDSDLTNFTPTGGFTLVNTGTIAGLATGGEYYRLAAGATGTATWRLTIPATVITTPGPPATTAPNLGGSFSVYFHIPDNVQDQTVNPAVTEARSSTVRYTITTTGANATTTTSTVSQTEANSSQFLAGPFQLGPGNTVTVTLNSNNNSNTAVLIADSMTLQPTVGDVQSTPTAINNTAYPTEFLGFKYWGIYVPAGATQTSPQQTLTGTTTLTGQAAISLNAPPDYTNNDPVNGTRLFHSGNRNNVLDYTGAATSPTTQQRPARLIRQVVYVGRSEPTAVSSITSDPPVSAATATTIGDSSATGLSYSRYGAVKVAPGATGNAAASWTVSAPANGNYFVSVHLPTNVINVGRSQTPDNRIPDASYTVSYPSGGTTVTRLAILSQTTGGDYTLATGAVPLLRNQSATITVYTGTQSAITNPQVVADSVTLTTGSQKGAIYCLDGFNGEVIWRYETPDSTRGPSAPVFSAPAVKRIHVRTGSTTDANGVVTPTYADKLVVIVGDNNGLVYCLDAVGYGDGTSNAAVIDPNTGQPIYLPQTLYGAAAPVPADAATGYTPHVGTTSVYWIYRPDANLPKKQPQTLPVPEETPLGVAVGAVRRTPAAPGVNAGAAIHLYDRDLPIPAAFGTASPNVFVDTSITDPTLNNAIVYLPNSNGTLYALEALGVPVTTTAAGNETSGDRFNNSLDLTTTQGDVPTPTTRWWFTLRGVPGAAGTGNSAAAFTSAPALNVTSTTVIGPPSLTTYAPTVYVGSSSEEGDGSNVGRLYALDGLIGPAGNGGLTPAAQTAPGTANYNLSQRPQTSLADTTHWSFPDAYGTDLYGRGQSRDNRSGKPGSLGGPRPALGNVTGSPVVFTNLNGAKGEGRGNYQTRIYFAANSGLEVPVGSRPGTIAAARPDITTTGRVWAVNQDGTVGSATSSGAVANLGSGNDDNTNVWAYPLANDPNNAGKDTVAEPQQPIGSFQNATPAIGFVQFPATITNGDSSVYSHIDLLRGALQSASVPMLYVATRGANDTALYALDIDGNGSQAGTKLNGTVTVVDATTTTTGKLIYRQVSPDGSIFQSSPALVANASSTGGNGGAVFAVAGNTLYDFSATPITNPFIGQAFPLIRQNAAFTGFGPISSPTVAAADVSDLTVTAAFTGLYGGANVTDWVYVGDSASGLCRGITPQDAGAGGIPSELGGIVPPIVDGVGTVDLSAIPVTYLVNNANAGSTSAAAGVALATGADADLPVYEWGQNVYIRIKNIVPPLQPNGTPILVIDKSATATGQGITAYGAGGPITFQLSDSSAGGVTDSATIPQIMPALPTAGPLADGFYVRTDTATTKDPGSNLSGVTTDTRYIAAYTYHIGDGSERLNTPGSQRRVTKVTQLVHVYTSSDGVTFTDSNATKTLLGEVTNGNEVSRPIVDANGKTTYTLDKVAPVDQPTFGILNPLGVRGGGLPLPLGNAYTQAFPIGDDLGPFRGIVSPMKLTNLTQDLQALANGNTIPTSVPPSTSGSADNPTARPAGDLSTTAPNTRTNVVVTSTPLIPHNGSGDNSDPTDITTPPAGRSAATSTDGLLSQNFGTPGQPYALDIFDRSALGTAGQTLGIRMSATPGGASGGGGIGGGLAWNDNSVLTSSGNVSGHDSVVNYLPWETAPLGVRAGPNTSADYPDIAAGNVSSTLYTDDGSSDLGEGRSTPKPATLGSAGANTDPVLSRTVYGNPVQVHVSVPNHQPANQQVYVDTSNGNGNGGYNAIGELTPAGLNGVQRSYPMGYYSTRRVFVPTTAGRYRDGAAFRDIRIYSGVPVDMSTSIVNPTTDVGPIPSALGVQTDAYLPTNSPALGLFAPINPNFNGFFQPVTVHNDGNVNLLNVHLDQKQYYQAANQNTPGQHILNLTSDSLDPLSFIPSYDSAYTTGPRATLPGGITKLPYLLVSSLDTDLVTVYGRNPALVANFNLLYPGATFHKPLPGSDSPSTLTVPDAPEDTSTGYSLPASSTGRPAINANGQATVTAPPYVSLAVPFGTPVGTYSQTVRVFEGLDTTGYTAYSGSSYNPLYPPQYGGAVGGIRAPSSQPTDLYQYGLQPISTTGTVVKGSVLEDRMTDGFTFGALPQIDVPSSNSVKPATPDFGPAAFRDPGTGRISVYWTSGAGANRVVPAPPATPQYDIFGYNVNYAVPPNYTNPAFLAATGGQSWWSPISGNDGKIFNDSLTHSGLTIAQNAGTVYSFDVTVTSTPTYTNKLYAYPVEANTGKIGSGILLTSDDSQVKYGVKGLLTGGGNFAFWTASTRGRTAIYYTGNFTGRPDPTTTFVLPVPAGLTSVSDPNPVLMPVAGNQGGQVSQSQIEVTFSGTASDGSVDLYNCRYLVDSANTSKLNLAQFVAVREIMAPVGNGYQSRDAAWLRSGQLNLFAIDTATGTEYPLLYDINAKPQFTRAIVDKASGQLVLTGIPIPNAQTGTLTAYIDGASGRVRFAPALPSTFRIEGLFVPQAKRITGAVGDKRADTAPVSFLDGATKPNDSPNLNPVAADRRWYIWRKSSSGQAGAATLFYKTQRLTAYLPFPMDTSKLVTVSLNGTAYDIKATGNADLLNVTGGPKQSARLYFPIASGAEGQAIKYSYTGTDGNTYSGPPAGTTDTVQWQDERRTSDTSVPPVNATQGLQSAEGYAVPIDKTVNENNVAAFLDPYAGTTVNGLVQSHKVWLFWNSTRNGTADLYMETIDPRFGP